MRPLACPLVAAALVFGMCLSAAAAAPDDIRTKVRPAPAPAPAEAVIDTQGIVYGLPFGASEDDVMAKFGKPAGYLRLDAHRTALVYGKSHLLLCYDGSFDAVRIDQSVVDWKVSAWLDETPPFTATGWQLSNGIRPEMNRKEVRDIVKGTEGRNAYEMTFSTEQCVGQLAFSHYSDRGEGDETYVLYNLLLARRHDGSDYWSQPPPLSFTGRAAADARKGKRLVGLMLTPSSKGVRVGGVNRNSPADKAGIRPGDLITGVNGESMVGHSAAELIQRMNARDASDLEITAAADNGTRTVHLERVDGGTFSDELVGARLALSEVKVSDAAPDFEAKSADGKTVRLADLKGSPVLINFTATWCVPCKEQAPKLVAASAKYRDQGLKVVSVYLDGPDKDVAAYARELGEDWPIQTDGKGWQNAVAQAYGVTGVPTNVLVARDGRILVDSVESGGLEAAIEAALK